MSYGTFTHLALLYSHIFIKCKTYLFYSIFVSPFISQSFLCIFISSFFICLSLLCTSVLYAFLASLLPSFLASFLASFLLSCIASSFSVLPSFLFSYLALLSFFIFTPYFQPSLSMHLIALNSLHTYLSHDMPTCYFSISLLSSTSASFSGCR